MWNTVVGMWFAFQPTMISFVIARTHGAAATGAFAYAVAQAYLFWGIGVYGMRRYQASDVTRRYSFAEYLRSRVVTVALMVVAALGFAGVTYVRGRTSGETLVLVLLVLGLRVVDSVEDVYLGHFQQSGRLDIGSKLSSVRSIASTLVIVAAIPLTHHLVLSVALGVAVSVLILVVLLPHAFVRPLTPQEKGRAPGRVRSLLWACAPLFAATFVSIYVSNAPRYAINAAMDLTAQGYFAWLSMPPFLITLLSTIIFNPVITRMATQWTSGDLAAFRTWVLSLDPPLMVPDGGWWRFGVGGCGYRGGGRA